jgi:heme-degrading monooxygenase HmoA
MVIITFRTRLKDGIDMQELEQIGARMYELGSAMPGFIAYKDFAAQDGESLTLVQFADLESLATWRDHPEHRAAQQRGREEFFSEYHIQVSTLVREYEFSPASGRIQAMG